MNAPAIIDTLTPLIPGAVYEVGASVDFATVYVPAGRLFGDCDHPRVVRRHFGSMCLSK